MVRMHTAQHDSKHYLHGAHVEATQKQLDRHQQVKHSAVHVCRCPCMATQSSLTIRTDELSHMLAWLTATVAALWPRLMEFGQHECSTISGEDRRP